MSLMKVLSTKIRKVSCEAVGKMAVKAAAIGANTTCGFVLYQEKVPRELKKYRKF